MRYALCWHFLVWYCSGRECPLKFSNAFCRWEALRIFSPQALQNYYYDGSSKMTDAEFENLQEELVWSGSSVAVLSSDEKRFLEATMSYGKGNPIMNDVEFDAIKVKLKAANSVVTQAGPRCSIRSKRVYSDAEPDYLKMTLLNLPAALLVLGFVFAIDDITGFEITKAIELPPPYSILFLWGLVLPTVYVLASSITNAVLPDALILKAPCPECGTENQAYFGGIFNVAGNTRSAVIECVNPNCLADNEFNALKREVLITVSSEEKMKAAAELDAKVAAMSAPKEPRAPKAPKEPKAE